jgi:methylmalonyl-CoA mutase C-terminal domain/subunit
VGRADPDLTAAPPDPVASRPRVLLAKTSLDGHWRGVMVVGQALRDAGFEVVGVGQATCDQIVTAAVEEDVDLVGLNVGGRIEVVERVLDALAAACPDVPVMAGGTIPPAAAHRLAARGVPVFPPGSSIDDIVRCARDLTDAPRGG